MAKGEERGQRASARKLPSDHRPQDEDTPPEWGKHLTRTKDPQDFPPPGLIPLTWHKFRCQKPYESKTFKVPNSRTADSLQSLRALIKITSSQKTMDPIKEPNENKEGKVPLLQEVPECRSNPLSTAPRPSALKPATRKRVASSLGPIPGKGKRSLTMSTVVEEPMDFAGPVGHQSNCNFFGTLCWRCHKSSPFPIFAKNDGSCLYTQGTLELNTSAQGSQEPSPSTQVPGQASLYVKATFGQPRSAQASSEWSFRSSSPPKEDLRCSPSPRGGSRHSKLKKTKSRQVSKEADLKSVPSENGGLKVHHSSKKGGKASTSDKGAIIRHSTSPHGTSSHTASTTTRTRLRHAPYTQEAIKTSPADQECCNSSTDGDSPNGSVTPSSPHVINDVRHPISTKEGFRHSLSVQEGQKPLTSASEGLRAVCPVQWGLIYSPVPKSRKFRHTLSLPADVRSSLSYQRIGETFPYEYGDSICDLSVPGGHRHSRSMSNNLKWIPRHKGSWSSNLSPQGGTRPSQCDQRGLRLSYGHQVQGNFTIFLSKKESLKHTPSNKMSLRCAPSDQREFRDVPSNQEWARTSTSALGSPQHIPSAHGGFRPYMPVKLKF
ncbi:hypothetical protein A6R68_01621 [Neotoma lepida]|uniref:Uncharacterized protein n=1 Tax=Neotoma lepida TaxID=56216 RepID=A0A1A6GV87_NEOLE|nr:hypothetical protein A6R68_01621 [Neotoma lepida]